MFDVSQTEGEPLPEAPIIASGDGRGLLPILEEIVKNKGIACEYKTLHGDHHGTMVAPAGSGKTRVLTERVRRLIKGGAAPSSILCVTFTRKAAGELKERLSGTPGIGQAWIGAFHSICYRILRAESPALGSLGYKSGFTTVDTAGARAIMKEVLRGLSADVRAEDVLHAISLCRLTLKDDSHDGFLHKAALLYKRRLLELSAMDFDDLLANTLWLPQSSDEIRLRYAQRFRHVLIDEFQDLDPCQWEIVKLLTSAHGKATAANSLIYMHQRERRLVYVALTRARDKLHLSYSMERTSGGRPSGACL